PGDRPPLPPRLPALHRGQPAALAASGPGGGGAGGGFDSGEKGDPGRMKIENKNRKKGKTDRELRGCRRKVLGGSEDLRERFTELRESIPPSSEELEGKNIPADPELGTEIRVSIEGALRDYLDPMIDYLVGVTAYEPPHGSRG